MKKYILKPGNHQFIPGSPAVHNNNNLTDEDAEWYLHRYPHIAALFAESPSLGNTDSEIKAISPGRKAKKKKDASSNRIADSSITHSLNQSFITK